MYEHKEIPSSFSNALAIRADLGLGTSSESLKNLIASARNEQIKLFWDPLGMPMGYISWSSVSKDTLYMLVQSGGRFKYPYERKDGYITFINEIVFNPTRQNDCNLIWQSYLRSKRCIAYIRKRKLQLFIRKNNKFQSTKIGIEDYKY